MWNLVYAGGFGAAFVLSFLLFYPVRRLACALGVLDRPSARKIHTEATPLLGGLAIFLAFVTTTLAGLGTARSSFLPEYFREFLPGILRVSSRLHAVLAGGLLVVAAGVADDILSLRPWQKLSLQVLCALVVFGAGIRISLFVPHLWFSLPLTVVWLVAMMNSFNLLDNMDGLSSGVACVCGAILFLMAFTLGQLFVATILAVFLGSVAGFLVHNFPPAKIFMGECGSSFLGWFLGVVAILLTFYRYEGTHTFLPILAPAVVFAVPFFDTLSVIWIRRRRGLPVFKADRNHFSHRLVALGMTQRQAVLLIYLVTFCTGIGALAMTGLNLRGSILIVVQAAVVLTVVGLLETAGRQTNEPSRRGT